MRRLQNAPSEAKCQRIAEILDQEHDGTLDLEDVETVCSSCVTAKARLISLKPSMAKYDLTVEALTRVVQREDSFIQRIGSCPVDKTYYN